MAGFAFAGMTKYQSLSELRGFLWLCRWVRERLFAGDRAIHRIARAVVLALVKACYGAWGLFRGVVVEGLYAL